MTYNDIYKKFLIEYDKADVSSSYPSLTNEEIAAILDKAMHALIAQKVTGNNPRKVALDMDSKAMSDIAPLIKYFDTNYLASGDSESLVTANNELLFKFGDTGTPRYLLDGIIKYNDSDKEVVNLTTSLISDKFKETIYNKPWIKQPIMYIQSSNLNDGDEVIHVLVDSRHIDKENLNPQLYIRGVYMPSEFKANQNSDEIFFPIHVGAAISNVTLGIQRDDQINGSYCDNISSKNKSYCELTALYWAWKNIKKIYPDLEYIGLNHYRRYFSFGFI